MVKIMLVILLFSGALYVNSQPRGSLLILENYNISLKSGTSIVATEYKRDLSGLINEMHHLPGFSVSAGISKLISPNWEFGYEFEYSTFNGFQKNPDFSAYHFGHFKISLMRIEPVIYKSHIQNHNFILTYHINNKEKKRIIPYVFIKCGSTRLRSKLKYQSDKELIFAKIGWNKNEPKASIFVSEMNIGIGFGNEIIIDSKISLNIQADLSMVTDDNMDGVHNFNAPPPEGYKNFVSGIYGRIMIGATYTINPDRNRIADRTYRLKNSFNNKSLKRQLFPWYSNKK